MAGPFDDIGQFPVDPIVPQPENPAVAPKPVQQAVKDVGSAVGSAAEGALELPKHIYGASEGLRQTGEYDPSPMYDAALLLAGGGMGAAEKGAAGIFGGVMARNADLPKLFRAMTMEVNEKTPQEIWEATGWFRGADHKWRFEINDIGSTIKNAGGSTVGRMLEHPELYKNYPDVAEIPRLYGSRPGSGFYTGPRYGHPEEAISVSENDYGGKGGSTHSVLLHEIQHAIQEREGFQQGENFESPLLYRAARQAVKSKYFPPEDRKRLAELYNKNWQDKATSAEKSEIMELEEKELYAKQKAEVLQRDLAIEAYMRHAGETEARNVQERQRQRVEFGKMSPERQKEFSQWQSMIENKDIDEKTLFNKVPTLTEDRSRDKQIIRTHIPGRVGPPPPKIRSNNPGIVGLPQAGAYNIDDYTDNPQHYDYDAAKAAGLKPDKRGHWPDTYKMPSHITFSDESVYNTGGAGHWEKMKDGKWSFTPGPINMQYHTMEELRDYFKKYEPDSTLIEPKQDKPVPVGKRVYNPFTDS